MKAQDGLRLADTLSTWWRRANVGVSILLLLLHLAAYVLFVRYFTDNLADPTDYFQYDFTAYYVAAAVLNSEQPILYDAQISTKVAASVGMQTRHTPYVYPSFFAVLFRPLATLPHLLAIAVWAVLNFLFLALSVRQLLLMLDVPFKWSAYAFAALIVCVFPLVYYNLLIFGQVNLLLLWLLLLTYSNSHTLSTPRQQIIAGLSLGMAIGIKLFMAVLIPYFWLYRRRSVAYVGVATFGLTLLIGCVGAGWSNTFRYFTQVFPALSGNNSLFWVNYSLSPTIQRMFTTVPYEYQYFFMEEPVTAHILPLSTDTSLGIRLGQLADLTLMGIMVLTLAVDWMVQRKNNSLPHGLRLSFLITTVLLVMPLSWAATNVLLLFPIVLLLSQRQIPRSVYEAQLSLMLVSSGLILVHTLWPLLDLVISQDLPFWILTFGTQGVLLVWMMLCFNVWRQNQPHLLQLVSHLGRNTKGVVESHQ